VSEIRAWLSLTIMVAVMLYAMMDRQVFTLVAAEMSKTLHLSNTQLGVLQGLDFAAFTFIAAYPIAWCADRFDRRWVLAACISSWAVGTAACGLVSGFSALFVAFAVPAAAEVGVAPIFMSMLPELFRGQARVTATMVYYIAVSLSVGAGLFLVGATISGVDTVKVLLPGLAHLENWRLAFLAAAAPFPIPLLIITFLPTGRASRMAARLQTTAAPIRPFLRSNRKSVSLVLGGMIFFALGVTAILAWTPVSCTRIFGLNPARVGKILGAVIAAASIAGITTGNFILRHYQRRLGFRAAPRVIWVTLMASLPLISLIPFARAPWQVFTCVGIQVFVATIAGASSISLLLDLAPAEVRTRIIAFGAMTNGPAVGLGIAASAFLGDVIKAGPESLFWGGVCVSVPAWILCILCLRVAERPFEATARESTGMQHPLDLPTDVARAGRSGFAVQE